METRGDNTFPESQSTALASHRNQTLWQITVPFIIVLVVLVVLAILAIFLPFVSASLWADISLIWLILPWLVITLMFAAILGGILYGVIKLTQILPRYFGKALDILNTVHQKVLQVSNAVANFVITVSAWMARIEAVFGKEP